jgi:hypothetical protein
VKLEIENLFYPNPPTITYKDIDIMKSNMAYSAEHPSKEYDKEAIPPTKSIAKIIKFMVYYVFN